MPSVGLDFAGRGLVRAALAELAQEVGNLPHQLRQALHIDSAAPPAVEVFRQEIQLVMSVLPNIVNAKSPPVAVTLSERSISLVRTALALKRRSQARHVQRSQLAVADALYSAELAKLVEPLDTLLNAPYLRATIPAERPRLMTFLTKRAADNVQAEVKLREPEYDPKHETLLSAALLQDDVGTMRQQCEQRRRALAVVFVDLDDFKTFNTDLGEVKVDQLVLPPVLRAVESIVFGHGRAYRHGGDEFVLLLPNHTPRAILDLASHLRSELNQLDFPSTTRKASMSAGVWITSPESHLTDAELVELAARAKTRANQAGKGRTAIWIERGSEFDELIDE